MNQKDLFEILAEIQQDSAIRDEYLKNPIVHLLNHGVRHEMIETVKQMINAALQNAAMFQKMNEFQFKEVEEHFIVMSRLRNGLDRTIKQMLSGFKITMIMYLLSFILGIALVITSIIYAIVEKAALLPIAFAGFGMIGIVTYFISNPPLKLQESRADLAQLQAAYFSWYQDLRHWITFTNDEYMLRYRNNIIDPSSAVKASADYKKTLSLVSEILIGNTRRFLQIIEDYVEKSRDYKIKNISSSNISLKQSE